MSFIRAKQRGVTGVFPHNANRRFLVPLRTLLLPVVFENQIGAVPDGTVGVPQSFDVAPLLSTTDQVVLTLTAGSLPVGISIVGLTLAGTPSGAEVTAFDITATNPLGSDTSSGTWTINL